MKSVKGRHARVRVRTGMVFYTVVFFFSATSLLYSLSPSFIESPEKDVLILLSTFFMVSSLHPLFHLITGRLFGIRFRHIFLDGPFKVQPTIKTDYRTYERLTDVQKAVFHLSGIIATFVAIFSGYFTAIIGGAAIAEVILKITIIFNAVFELSPPLLVNLGVENFKKSDFYRFWSICRSIWKKRR